LKKKLGIVVVSGHGKLNSQKPTPIQAEIVEGYQCNMTFQYFSLGGSALYLFNKKCFETISRAGRKKMMSTWQSTPVICISIITTHLCN
jgi:hypothetical protein